MALGDAKSGRDVDPTLRPDSRLAFRRPGGQTHGAHRTPGIIFADGCRSQYLHTANKAITELYELNIEDPRACAQRVEYLLEEDRCICPPGSYKLSF